VTLTPHELERHRRHILLKEIGGPGVQKLRAASVSIIGAGALGGPCALYLAAAGAGRIEIWDDDTVERSNLGGRSSSATPIPAPSRRSNLRGVCGRSTLY